MLDELLDIVVAELIAEGVGVGLREPVDQRHAAGVRIRVGIVVDDQGSVGQVAVNVTHGLDGIGIDIAVRTGSAKLGIERAGAKVAIAFGRGGHPRGKRLLVGLKALVVVLVAGKEE